MRLLMICALLLYSPILLSVCHAESSHTHSHSHRSLTFLQLGRGGGVVTDPDATVGNANANVSLDVDVNQNEEIQKSSNDRDEDEAWRNSLPTQLQNRRGALYKILVPTRVTKTIGSPQSSPSSATAAVEEEMCEVYLLGTAHVSKDSCMDVQLLMDHVQPDVLFIELCDQRLAVLDDEPLVPNLPTPDNNDIDENDNNDNDNEGKEKSVNAMVKEILVHNPEMSRAAALSSVLLTKIQGDYASKLGVTIGGEFREAYKKARAQQEKFNELVERLRWEQTQYGTINEETLRKARSSNGCSIVLGDRPVRLTLLRAWEALSFFGKIKLVLALTWSSLRQPSDEELREWMESIMNDPTNDILTKSIEELSKHFPAVKRTIIEERDTYMACKILQTANILGTGSVRDGVKRKIVAVVGAGHCPGISKMLLNERSQSRSHSSSSDNVGMSNSNTRLAVEDELRKVIETKKYKIEDPHVMSLMTEVVSMEAVA